MKNIPKPFVATPKVAEIPVEETVDLDALDHLPPALGLPEANGALWSASRDKLRPSRSYLRATISAGQQETHWSESTSQHVHCRAGGGDPAGDGGPHYRQPSL
jgi:hypothetical protein